MARGLMAETDQDLDDLFLEDDDGAPDPVSPAHEQGWKWRVLIVDDDADVHIVTTAVLNDISFHGRGLQITSCYSGSSACAFLETNTDISVVLLDVVMETDDAGLTHTPSSVPSTSRKSFYGNTFVLRPATFTLVLQFIIL
jgi:PleD family two-component response regulator